MGDTFRKDVKPPGHAVEGNVTDERTREVRGSDAGGGESVSDLCARFGISRKQGYKWKQRGRSTRYRVREAPRCRGASTRESRCRRPVLSERSSRSAGSSASPRRVRRSDPYKDRLGPYDATNRVWCADFKGHFPVSGERCNPLTVSDGFSRYLLTCKALRSTTEASGRAAPRRSGTPHRYIQVGDPSHFEQAAIAVERH
jgi:putative transposase